MRCSSSEPLYRESFCFVAAVIEDVKEEEQQQLELQEHEQQEEQQEQQHYEEYEEQEEEQQQQEEEEGPGKRSLELCSLRRLLVPLNNSLFCSRHSTETFLQHSEVLLCPAGGAAGLSDLMAQRTLPRAH